MTSEQHLKFSPELIRAYMVLESKIAHIQGENNRRELVSLLKSKLDEFDCEIDMEPFNETLGQLAAKGVDIQ